MVAALLAAPDRDGDVGILDFLMIVNIARVAVTFAIHRVFEINSILLGRLA